MQRARPQRWRSSSCSARCAAFRDEAPALDFPGGTVEVPDPAAGHQLTAGDLDRLVVGDGEAWCSRVSAEQSGKLISTCRR